MSELEHLISDLPDPDAARRFLHALDEQQPREASKLRRNDGLLSDCLTIAAYSPLLATTLLQNPDYFSWLNRERRAPVVRTKDELLESLGRFVLTHSQVDLHAQLARFRRRELLRIFLSDIRRLKTVAEITEDISNLADAILETALRRARQDVDNRFGNPLVIDEKGKTTVAEYCIVSLGKLGSRELNYSSDIDLLFLYSAEGETSGAGSGRVITNREYFVKLSESVTHLVGRQTGEGAAYRVDMRLRPHGRVGPLAISVSDAVRYYRQEARDWERQVLIRSRVSAGDGDLYRRFIENVEDAVFSTDISVDAALDSVRTSKQRIDVEQRSGRGFNVKLGRGGIREIEFIAQALQLAYGGADRWLRSPHTLISLARLADRGHISEKELTELFNAYEYLRRAEHVLQMENGLQTHTVPDEADRRLLLARRMGCDAVGDFEKELDTHTGNVHRVFRRVFDLDDRSDSLHPDSPAEAMDPAIEVTPAPTDQVHDREDVILERAHYADLLARAIQSARDFRGRLGSLRREWTRLVDAIAAADRDGSIDLRTAKRAQTALAEASIDTALRITSDELGRRYKSTVDRPPLTVMGLGKLGGAALDYESDLDVVLISDPRNDVPSSTTAPEFYSRAAELFVTTLSSITREGHLYRVDLRLRPYGKNGTSSISSDAFADYMREKAAIWEWLAYVKIRAVAGDIELAYGTEETLRNVIHERASKADKHELASETRRMRMLLEKEKARTRRSREVDIKYGSGGMLDIYFAMRYLQLRDDVRDRGDDRSTGVMLGRLHEAGSINREDFLLLDAGYRFLAQLDHELRLSIGRTTRFPAANTKALESIAERMNLESPERLAEQLTVSRLGIRDVFDRLLPA